MIFKWMGHCCVELSIKYLDKTLFQWFLPKNLASWNRSLWRTVWYQMIMRLPLRRHGGSRLLFVNLDSKEINEVLGCWNDSLREVCHVMRLVKLQQHWQGQFDWCRPRWSNPFNICIFFSNNAQISHTAMLTCYWFVQTSSFSTP